MEMGGQRHSPADLPPGKTRLPGWAPGPVWTGAENQAPHRDSITGPSSRSESLYRLSYPGPPQQQ